MTFRSTDTREPIRREPDGDGQPAARTQSWYPQSRHLDRAEEDSLWRTIRDPWAARSDARNARERLICGHLAMVGRLARRRSRPGVEIDDLIQAGMVGLLHAIDSFDPSRGYRFMTYAITAVEHAMREVAYGIAAVYVPSRARTAAWNAEGDETALVMAAMRAGESLAAPTDDGRSLADKLPDVTAHDPSEHLIHAQRREAIRRALLKLSPREGEVLRLRFGVDGERGLGVQECALRLGISEGVVATIERGALQRLRADSTVQALSDGPAECGSGAPSDGSTGFRNMAVRVPEVRRRETLGSTPRGIRRPARRHPLG